MEQNGTLWECKLHIAKADDGRKIIYDVDIEKEVGKRDATKTVATSHSTSFKDVTQSVPKGNTPDTNMAAAFEKAGEKAGKHSKEAKYGLNDAPVLAGHSTIVAIIT